LTLLTITDLGVALSIGAVVWSVLTPLNAGVWTLSALSAWSLTGRPRHPLGIDRSLRPLCAPALAFLVCLLLGTLHGALGEIQGPPLQICLLMAALWSASMMLARHLVQRVSPDFIFGVIPGASVQIQQTGVRFLELDLAHPEQLDHVDGVLMHPSETPVEWSETLAHALSAGVPVWSRAQLLELIQGKVPLEQLHAERLNVSTYQSNYAVIKRVFDVAATLLVAPLLLPLLLMVALVVLLDAGAPVLFFQRRVGQNGRVFTIAKFRTMRRDSEAAGAAFATSGDLRVTRVGRVLRKFRLDELPQFFNVLRGDMSIIGPRPEQEGFVENFSQGIRLYNMRHWVRPGITGWAQVRQGYAAGADETTEKLRHDVYYIKHFSLGLDLQVVWLTILTVLTGFGAR